MATKTETVLLDDIDGGPADETVQFGLDGVRYEIDLSGSNAATLRSGIARYVEAARPVGGRPRRRRTAAGKSGLDTNAIRAWAKTKGYAVSDRGRVPASIVEEYEKARG